MRGRLTLAIAATAFSWLPACNSAPTPASVTASDLCASCRMAVSDPRVAAQVVAPGEEPDFYDDIGCLARDLAKRTLSPDAVVFVADHRTGEWVGAGGAVYVRVPGLATPMGSGIVAHASAASRDGDAAARAGQSLTLQDVFGPAGLPGGPR